MSNQFEQHGDAKTLRDGAGQDLAARGDDNVALSDESLNLDQGRRNALKKFAAFSAPAMIALITANEAAAS